MAYQEALSFNRGLFDRYLQMKGMQAQSAQIKFQQEMAQRQEQRYNRQLQMQADQFEKTQQGIESRFGRSLEASAEEHAAVQRRFEASEKSAESRFGRTEERLKENAATAARQHQDSMDMAVANYQLSRFNALSNAGYRDAALNLQQRSQEETVRHNLATEGAAAGKDAAEAQKDVRDYTMSLRKEYSMNPQTKAYTELTNAYGRILSAYQKHTPASDLAMIFGIMKMYDPTSVVREGEQESARKTGGITDRLWSTYMKVASGETLSPDVREDFMQQAHELYREMATRQAPIREMYADEAKTYNADPNRVVGDMPYTNLDDVPESKASFINTLENIESIQGRNEYFKQYADRFNWDDIESSGQIGAPKPEFEELDLGIFERAYASGEIDKEEYEDIITALQQNPNAYSDIVLELDASSDEWEGSYGTFGRE